jgi:hypothetical protein
MLALLALVLAVLARDARAAPFDLAGTDWEGCSDFLQMARDDLGAQRILATHKLDMRTLQREDAIILLHPERSLDVESLASFMRHGGRVVLLDDYGTGEALLSHFSIARVPLPAHPQEMLRGNPELALAEPASAHPLVRDVTKVVTNHATGVRHPDLSPVLEVRGGPGEPDVLLAEAGAVGQGRFLAVGDPSILINSMLRYPGNRAFARALLRYATDDNSWGKRGGRVFVAEGDFEEAGTFGEDSQLWDTLREWYRAIEDALESMRHQGLPAAAAYAVAIAVALGLVLWVGSRAGKTHRASPPRFVRPIPLVAQGGVAGHAAVIASPATSRVLAMLELKSALEEDLAHLLGLDRPGFHEGDAVMPGHEELLRKVGEARLLDEDGMRALKQLLLRMANVETILLSRRGSALDKIRDREVIATAKAVQRILAEAHRAAAHAKEKAA